MGLLVGEKMTVTTTDTVLESAAGHYDKHGFAIVQIFDEAQANIVDNFAEKWLRDLLRHAVNDSTRPLATYHTWWQAENVPHSLIFRAANRHASPVGTIRDALLSTRLWEFLSQLQPGRFALWDEGLGWLGFRFVRPGMGDGYPPSRKEWGPAKNVVSCWIPVIGRSKNETLAMLPGSHLKDYDKYLPNNSQFCASEYRLVDPPDRSAFLRPGLQRGEVLFTHPRLIHTEEVWESDITRLNLEVRFKPE